MGIKIELGVVGTKSPRIVSHGFEKREQYSDFLFSLSTLKPRSILQFWKEWIFSLYVQQKIHFSTGIFSGQLTRNELEDVIHYSHLTLYRQCQKKFHAISTFYTTASDELMTK